jgi:hypothetical protein
VLLVERYGGIVARVKQFARRAKIKTARTGRIKNGKERI